MANKSISPEAAAAQTQSAILNEAEAAANESKTAETEAAADETTPSEEVAATTTAETPAPADENDAAHDTSADEPAPATQESEPASEEESEGEGEGESDGIEETADSYAGKSKTELADMLAQAIETQSVPSMRREVEALKIAFYKVQRAENEAARKAFAESGGDPDTEFVPEADEVENRFKELLKEYRRRRDEYTADMDRIKEENYKTKLHIIEQLKELINSDEKLGQTFARFRELQQQWKETGAVPQQYVKDLWETYNLHVENFYNVIKINKELRDLDLRKNLEHKEALCEAAEALESEKSVVDAFHKLQKLHDEWRETGPVAEEHKERLWERFKAASTLVNKRHQEYFEMIKEEQVRNLDMKSALCDEVESIIAANPSSLKAWNKASDKLTDIQTRWRGIGFAPRKDNNRIYERFRAACDKFFDMKRDFFARLREEMDANLKLKNEICEAAEALSESEEWKSATDKIIALQAEWKKIGAVSRRHSDAVWKRFRAACDKFFERKSKHFASMDGEYEDNLARKNALIEEMLAADIEQGGYEMIKEFQRRWSEIGYVPIKAKSALQKQYKKAVDKMFSVLRSSEQERSFSRFRDKVSSLAASGDKRLRTERDRLYNKVRQLEQDIATLENNIGFFSNSKGAESLIADVNNKINKTKRELAETIEKVKLIDESTEQ